jgi:hypothetical protein
MKMIRISLLLVLGLFIVSELNATTFYVDPANGSDLNLGTIEKPFQTIDKAMSVVSKRISKGIYSDKVFLRGGIYRKTSDKTLYRLNLKGTPENFAVFSAMPCDSTASNARKSKNGQWYEKVVFDDSWTIESQWAQVNDNPKVWKTNPGYTHLEWTHQNLWNWRSHGFPISNHDSTPETTSFTVAPYLLLQDGEPSVWANKLEDLTEPGHHFYDHSTKTLYLFPKDNKDPNKCKIETWYGGNENYEVGTLHLDGEGRALFDGNLEYAVIRGFEFRMFNKLFELHRRKYDRESERVIQRDVIFEDNYCEYGWIQILLDANTVLDSLPGVIRPRYGDRARWTVRNNVFYRPSREVFQLHGDDHIFEENVVIDHLGPWAGPAVCVSAVNTRNTRNAMIRNNCFVGQGNNPWNSGSVFMIESSPIHADESGDYIFGGQTYENNLIANVSSGAAFVLGKGGARLQNITIRNNIIAINGKSPAIQMGSPQKNLLIEGNIFYQQRKIVDMFRNDFKLVFNSMTSDILIRNNLFVENRELFHENLLNPPLGGQIIFSDNIYWANGEKPVGVNSREVDPNFAKPDQLDFRIENVELYNVLKMNRFDWSKFRKDFPQELPVKEEYK